MGKMDQWERCKSRTECAFNVSGYEQVLTDATDAGQNTQMNRVVYSQLAVATVGGTAHRLVKQHEDDNNGYGACNTLCEWYYGYAVKNETEDSLRFKLEIYHITSASNAA